jgi:lysine-specific demethylase 8
VSKFPARPVRVEFNAHGVFDFNENAPTGPVATKDVTFAEAVRLIEQSDGSNGAYYLRELPVHERFPELVPELTRPLWIHLLSRRYAPRLWFGSRGCVSPLHFDGGDQNILAQIYGRKEMVLFSPGDSPCMYPNFECHLPHLSKVNYFRPDLDRFPAFARATPFKVLLEPGDAIYVPAYWWHTVRSLEISISLNYWWLPWRHANRALSRSGGRPETSGEHATSAGPS